MRAKRNKLEYRIRTIKGAIKHLEMLLLDPSKGIHLTSEDKPMIIRALDSMEAELTCLEERLNHDDRKND